jgi:dihydropteroate synthase
MTHRACLAGITVGDGVDVAVVGAINVSPESFYPGSIATDQEHLLRAAEIMAGAGAAFVDVGAMSTAPYLKTRIDEAEEADRLAWAVDLIVTKLGVIVSADTSRARPARAALDAGARIINDVSGLTADEQLAAELARRPDVGLILMAHEPRIPVREAPTAVVARVLDESLARARAAGIDANRIVVDPGIGFFRHQAAAWHEWDVTVLGRLGDLRVLGRPVAVAVSRKSFVGALTGEVDPARRLPGSLAATAVSVLHGAHLIRTHDVAETLQAVRVAQTVRRARDGR